MQQQSQQAQQQSRINPAQLHQILQKNQLPDGRQLNEQMRQIIVQKLQLQQNRDPQQQQMLQQRGASGSLVTLSCYWYFPSVSWTRHCITSV